jgi:hypothetical protein
MASPWTTWRAFNSGHAGILCGERLLGESQRAPSLACEALPPREHASWGPRAPDPARRGKRTAMTRS